MATSSITHNFDITDPEIAERFANLMEELARDYVPTPNPPGRELTDPDEILALMAKRKKR